MNVIYKCQFCGKVYEWYDGLYENPNEESGVYINVNGLVLKYIKPIYDFVNGSDEPIVKSAASLPITITGRYINFCPECMRKLLDSLRFEDGNNAWRNA